MAILPLVGALRQTQGIENQRHLAVAHDGGAGEGADAFELFAQGLDHNLFGIVDLVDHQAELAVIGL